MGRLGDGDAWQYAECARFLRTTARVGSGKLRATPERSVGPRMKRIRIDRPGGYDALRIETCADPQPGPRQVRIAVEACGVNYADGIIRMGLYASARELHGYPITPGFEVAGRIEALGADVAEWQVGDAVIALTLFDGYSSHLCLDAAQVFALPAPLTMAEGASLPWMEGELVRGRDQIRASVVTDPGRWFSVNDFDDEVNRMIEFARTRPVFVRCQVDQWRHPGAPPGDCAAR